MSDSQPGPSRSEAGGRADAERLPRRVAALVIFGLSASLWALIAMGLYWL